MYEKSTRPGGEDDRAWWYQPEVALLVTLVTAIYFCRLTSIPICGEESRWACGACLRCASVASSRSARPLARQQRFEHLLRLLRRVPDTAAWPCTLI